jgi:hypothetical protein
VAALGSPLRDGRGRVGAGRGEFAALLVRQVQPILLSLARQPDSVGGLLDHATVADSQRKQ